jgi:hypothetical protein
MSKPIVMTTHAVHPTYGIAPRTTSISQQKRMNHQYSERLARPSNFVNLLKQVLTEVEKGVWSITYENVAAAENYQFKFIANDSYTYNWTSDGAFDGQINPDIVVDYDNSTVKLTIDVTAYDFATKTGTVTTNVEIIPPVDAPTEGPTEPTEPVEVDYYLFGYIDGANYGDVDDFENMGNYKFVDGTVTATFEKESYVGVKTTDNATWYMTDGWAGNVTSVTLYDANTLGTTADKLMVPAGKVTFTLVANEDGTLTLSYVVVERPTEAPTQAPTEAPTAAPVVKTDGYYVTGDINLKLTPSGTGKVRGTIALQAGTYKFKLNNYGTLLGYGKSFTDSTKGLTFKSTYGSYCTLNATGGTYTFQVNLDKNTLVVNYDKNLPEEYLIGDINTILSPVAGRPLAIGTAYLEAGTYKFKISDNAVLFGNGGNCTDSTAGRSVSFKSTYGSYYTLNATGGNYTFTYYTATNKLIIKHSPVKDEALDDVHLSGEINLVLDDNNGDSNIATGTVKLAEGTYAFKVYNYGQAVTVGGKITDNGTKKLFGNYSTPLTLIASGGTYTFSFNKTTNEITIEMA